MKIEKLKMKNEKEKKTEPTCVGKTNVSMYQEIIHLYVVSITYLYYSNFVLSS